MINLLVPAPADTNMWCVVFLFGHLKAKRWCVVCVLKNTHKHTQKLLQQRAVRVSVRSEPRCSGSSFPPEVSKRRTLANRKPSRKWRGRLLGAGPVSKAAEPAARGCEPSPGGCKRRLFLLRRVAAPPPPSRRATSPARWVWEAGAPLGLLRGPIGLDSIAHARWLPWLFLAGAGLRKGRDLWLAGGALIGRGS